MGSEKSPDTPAEPQTATVTEAKITTSQDEKPSDKTVTKETRAVPSDLQQTFIVARYETLRFIRGWRLVGLLVLTMIIALVIWLLPIALSGVAGFIFGFAFKRTRVEEGEFKGKDIATFNVIQVIGNAVAWILVAPILDIVIYAEPVNLVFTQGITAFIMNSVSGAVIGTLLLVAYAATRPKKGSLTKE